MGKREKKKARVSPGLSKYSVHGLSSDFTRVRL